MMLQISMAFWSVSISRRAVMNIKQVLTGVRNSCDIVEVKFSRFSL